MTQSTITAVSVSNAIAFAPQSNRPISVPSIELSLSDGTQFKSACILTGTEALQKGSRTIIKAKLEQILVGREVTTAEFIETCDQIATATYTMQEMRLPDPVEKSTEALQKESRREMLSMIGMMDPIEPEPVLTDIHYPMPPHIVRGATAALLLASAHAENMTPSAFVRALLPDSHKNDNDAPLKIGLHVDMAEHGPLIRHAAAMYYPVPAAAGADSLGATAEKFQRYLRQLGEWIAQSWQNFEPEKRPSLFVDLNGATHRLVNEQVARTMGTLFGFGKTGDEQKMIFANAVINESALKTANDQTYLQSLLKSKKLKMRLAAGEWTNTRENVSIWLEKCKPQLIVLKLNETANLGELISMMSDIYAHDTGLILVGSDGGNEHSWAVLHEIAAGASPEFYVPAGGLRGAVQAINR